MSDVVETAQKAKAMLQMLAEASCVTTEEIIMAGNRLEILQSEKDRPGKLKPSTISEKVDYLFEREWRSDLHRLRFALDYLADPSGLMSQAIIAMHPQASQESSPACGRHSASAVKPLQISVFRALSGMGPRFAASLQEYIESDSVIEASESDPLLSSVLRSIRGLGPQFLVDWRSWIT